MKNLIVFGLAVIVMAIGCTPGKQIKKAHIGMTKQEVIFSAGQPDASKKVNKWEVLNYHDKLTSEWSWKYGWSTYKSDYHFVFKNNHLTAWGKGDVTEYYTSDGTVSFLPRIK